MTVTQSLDFSSCDFMQSPWQRGNAKNGIATGQRPGMIHRVEAMTQPLPINQRICDE